MEHKLVIGQSVRWINDDNIYLYGIITYQIPNTELFVIETDSVLRGLHSVKVHRKRLETGRWDYIPRWIPNDK